MKNTLDISDLAIGYKKPLLRNFNLQLPEGEVCALIGRNGTGKTTLLKTVAGLIAPLEGHIVIQGNDIARLRATEKARLVSLVLTQRISLQGIDVKTLVMMGRYPMQGRYTFSSAGDEEMVMQCIRKLHITHLAEKPLAELSDGEMQKAMIARTLAQQTPLLVMDEPTAFLDYVAREELFEMLQQLSRDEKITILFSSHDLELVKKYAGMTVQI